jgi:predicted nicotinamide N-methyase
MTFDRARFIKSETRLAAAPLLPEIRLYLADEATALWERTEAELGGLHLPPPFWAFAWAGGQALARHILDNPTLVAGKHVLDFASGCGLAAIAAAKAGARHVIANDIDAFALVAVALNAAENNVTIETCPGDIIGAESHFDVILAGDIAYEQDTARRVTDWLEALAQRGIDVLIGDPRRAYLASDRLAPIAAYDVPVSRLLEDKDVKRAEVYRFRSATAGLRETVRLSVAASPTTEKYNTEM